MSRIRLAILAGVLLPLLGLAFAAGRVRPIALVLPLIDVELWPVPLGLRVRILKYGALLLSVTLPVWPVVAVLAGIALAAIWWPLRTRAGGNERWSDSKRGTLQRLQREPGEQLTAGQPVLAWKCGSRGKE